MKFSCHVEIRVQFVLMRRPNEEAIDLYFSNSFVRGDTAAIWNGYRGISDSAIAAGRTLSGTKQHPTTPGRNIGEVDHVELRHSAAWEKRDDQQ